MPAKGESRRSPIGHKRPLGTIVSGVWFPPKAAALLYFVIPAKAGMTRDGRDRAGVPVRFPSMQENRRDTYRTAPSTKSLARSPIMIAVALVLPCGIVGMIEASATHRPATPRTAQSAPTTANGSSAAPILAVPAGWNIGIVAART